ncbi:MAG: M48 family metalloprotease [Nitrospinae bacterium]|nr:M48 family metalloprotease [Nitrospinota bacterium]
MEPFSRECGASTFLWQKAIDTIVLKNFPQEWGYYKAVVWEDDFDNAWVVKGREIHITGQFLHRLNRVQLLAVAAHELGHLKMGHYYSKIGIIIADMPQRGKKSAGNHYSGNISETLAKGFGEEQEEEADRAAVQFLEQVGLDPRLYLNFLHLIHQGSEDPEIITRITAIKKLIRSR